MADNKHNGRTILLAGYPRSGTTWVSNLINSHPAVVYRHEFLGRCYEALPEDLFNALKYNHGVDDDQYEHLFRALSIAEPEADRPPFFYKNHLRIGSPQLHQLCWLATRQAPGLCSRLYRWLFTPTTAERVILLKETRSSANMESMIKGLRVDTCIFLFRHPCACVASLLTGIARGDMTPSTEEHRRIFYQANLETLATLDGYPELQDVLAMEEHQFAALAWTVQNEDYLRFSSNQPSIFVNYDAVIRAKTEQARRLFRHLGLQSEQQSNRFLEETESTPRSLLKRDSGSTFYSVYRDSTFNPDQWRETLESKQIAHINDIASLTHRRLLDAEKVSDSCVA